MAARLGVIGLLLALVVRAGAWRQRPHRRFFVELLPAAVAAQLLDGLASDLPASLLIELELLGANMHSAQCLRERVAHQFGVGHFASLNSQQNKTRPPECCLRVWRSRRVWIRAWRTACGVCPYPLSNLSLGPVLATVLRDNSGPSGSVPKCAPGGGRRPLVGVGPGRAKNH